MRLNDGLPLDHVSSDLATVLLAINQNCGGSLEEAVLELGGSGEVVCIIHDELMYFCEAVAARFGVRSLVFRTTSAAACVSRCAVLQLYHQGHLPLHQGNSKSNPTQYFLNLYILNQIEPSPVKFDFVCVFFFFALKPFDTVLF